MSSNSRPTWGKLGTLLLVFAMAVGVLALPAGAEDVPPDVEGEPGQVTMICQPGQIDVNGDTAELSQLGLSAPVTRRIIATQPHYQPEDLLLVAGIGPSDYEALVATLDLCASTPVPPPTPPDACTGNDRLDLTTASENALTDVFASRPSAQRLIAWRTINPLPNIEHALIAAGISAGKQKKLEGQLCVTPPHIRGADVDGNVVDYEWILPTGGSVASVDDARYELTVPTGVLDEGAWASVTVLPARSEFEDWPAMDAHIYAPWTGTVDVQLARDDFEWTGLDMPSAPAIYHELASGTWDVIFDSVIATDRTVATSLDSLSNIETNESPWWNAPYMVLDWLGGHYVSEPNCSPSAADRIDIAGPIADPSLAGGALIKLCSEGKTNGGATVKQDQATGLIFDYAFSDYSGGFASAAKTRLNSSLTHEIITTLWGGVSQGDRVGVDLNPVTPPIENADYVTWPGTAASVNWNANEAKTVSAALIEFFASKVLSWVGDQSLLALADTHPVAAYEIYALTRTYLWDLASCATSAFGIGEAEVLSGLDQCLPDNFDDLEDTIGVVLVNHNVAQQLTFKMERGLARIGVDGPRALKAISGGLMVLDYGSQVNDYAQSLNLGNGLVYMDLHAATPDSWYGYDFGPGCLTQFNQTGWRLDKTCQAAYVAQFGGGDDVDGTVPPTDLGPGNLVEVKRANGTDFYFWDSDDGKWRTIDNAGVWGCLQQRYGVQLVNGVPIILPGQVGDPVDTCEGDKYVFAPSSTTVVHTNATIDGATWWVVDPAGTMRRVVNDSRTEARCLADIHYGGLTRENMPTSLLIGGYTDIGGEEDCLSVSG